MSRGAANVSRNVCFSFGSVFGSESRTLKHGDPSVREGSLLTRGTMTEFSCLLEAPLLPSPRRLDLLSS